MILFYDIAINSSSMICTVNLHVDMLRNHYEEEPPRPSSSEPVRVYLSNAIVTVEKTFYWIHLLPFFCPLLKNTQHHLLLITYQLQLWTEYIPRVCQESSAASSFPTRLHHMLGRSHLDPRPKTLGLAPAGLSSTYLHCSICAIKWRSSTVDATDSASHPISHSHHSLPSNPPPHTLHLPLHAGSARGPVTDAPDLHGGR